MISQSGRKSAGVTRKVKVLRFLAVLLVVWFLLAWIAARSLVVHADLPRADALLVLSGSSNYVERARWAARLYREGRAPLILLTDDGQQGGWSTEEQRNPFFVERAMKELKQSGVPAEKIEVLPGVVSSTYAEALSLREYASGRGLRSVLVVTSAYHSRRALWTMRRVMEGSNTEVGVDAPPAGGESPAPAVWWTNLRGWQMVAGEYPKMLYYHLRY
ncbi:MAG TPA: YdcF family protein [Pyrinomonadaceae bacterium]|nr:YdcF family protein [Pyrinomonadaceae bacterium]